MPRTAAQDTGEVFTGYTHVTDEDGEHHAFAPGQDIPAWAQDKVGAHLRATRQEWQDAQRDAPGVPVALGDELEE